MILLLLTGAVYFFLKYISPLIAPVLVAALMVFACIPFFDRIRKKIRFPRMLLMSFVYHNPVFRNSALVSGHEMYGLHYERHAESGNHRK